MNRPNLPDLSSESARAAELEAACLLLRNCLATAPPSRSLRQALQQVVQASDLQILGICAESLAVGQQTLTDYTIGLGMPQPTSDLADLAGSLEGAVYIKHNPLSRCYASPYSGSERGVLISCQSADAADISELFGPLPLDLFSERA